MAKIVILDGFVANPGDLSWEPLAELGELTVHEYTAPQDVVARIGDAPVILTNKTVISAEVMTACPNLRYIGVLATGYNVVDIAEAKKRGIVVTNVPAYSTPTVAQFTMALLLEIALHVGHHSRVVHEGKWSACRDFAFWDYPLMELAGKYSVLKVRANADTPKDAAQAFEFGAEGIGLCRTEHMFFEGDRIKAIREMILSDDEAGRRVALNKLLPMQRGDFEGLFKAMQGHPVTVRLLDPPLHEFVPHDLKGQQEMADEMGVPVEKIIAKVEALAEFNPMLGHRGCRLGNTYPEITEMQTRAIIEAAMNVKATGMDVHVEIMVPLVGNHKELRYQKNIIDKTAEQVFSERNDKIDYMVGTMIEVPRAAVTANQIAEVAQFFSFGTNDLTQMTLGFSRDDISKFLPIYLEKGILKNDPFQILDRNGVGQLIREAVFKGRGTRDNLKCGICGEHGGEPSSVEFCHYAGLNYVSCSPFRVPIARLAAAHAALNQK